MNLVENTDQIQIKKEELFLWKIKNDRLWYMENFLKIRNKAAKLVSFKPNPAQEYFNNIINETEKAGKLHRYIILKARQLGMSTFVEGWIFHDTATDEYINSMIIAHEDKATQNLFNMSKLMYDELPESIKPMKKYSNEKALSFENPTNNDQEKAQNPGLRSKITVATANTANTGRSGNITKLHASEVAFWADAKTTMLSLLQSVPDEPNTLVVLESTANGVGGYFYDQWQLAVAGKSDYIPIFLPWFVDHAYSRPFTSKEEKEKFVREVEWTYKDEKGQIVHTEEWILKDTHKLTYEQLHWRKFTIANKCGGDVDLFKQEYPSIPEEAFIASGRPRFDNKILNIYNNKCNEPLRNVFLERKGKEVKAIENVDGYISIFREPEKDMSYYIGADVAEGLITGDYSDAVVLNDKLEVCAVWHGHIDPDLYGKELVKLGLFYNEAFLVPEANNHGRTTIKSITDEDYYNIFWHKTYDKLNECLTKKIGWQTNQKTKPLMIDKLAEYLREMYLVIDDKRIIGQFYTYVIDEKGSTNAQQGCYDDLVIATGLAVQGYLDGKSEDHVPEISDIVTKKKEEDILDIIDPLFEGEEYEYECT